MPNASSRTLSALTWLDPSDVRIGLGCMRLTDDETVAAALGAGITVFDTARAYEGNEERLGRVLRGSPVRIVTKGGMGPDWVPDGRSKTIRADCEASLEALDGLPIDLYLVHAPDPRTPWATTVRALARLVDEGLVPRVGLANVNRRQLDEALELAPIAAVEVALSVLDDRARRSGVLERCEELGLALIAHSPLGGVRRAGRLSRDPELVELAAAHNATPAEIALARLLALSPVIVPIPGARRPETARSAARAASIRLEPPKPVRRPARGRRGDVVLVMGIPGAGKTRIAAELEANGFERLNRDERGGSLRALGAALDDALAGGARRIVLDNTYLTRAARSYSVEAAAAHGLPVRCIWLDTPLAQAQVNLIERLLDRVGHLPEPEELRALARGPGLLLPTSQMRTVRELEPPAEDEGFAAVERVEFERAPAAGRAGVFVAASALDGTRKPDLVFDWRPDGGAIPPGPYETAVCMHGAGPPVCWCRPPLPGLIVEFARRRGFDPAKSTLVGTSAAHRTLARTLGADYVARP